MSGDAIVEPPEEVRRRAWECLSVMKSDCMDRLGGPGRKTVLDLAMRAHETLSWEECRTAFVLFDAVWEVRK